MGVPYEEKTTVYTNIMEASMTNGQEIYGQTHKSTSIC